ncbi:hypothetical protein HOC01_01495 [archaeon]|nr:hypothetical protein [archaeon]MBT6698007.1 hypothetical protein [archaeon]
MANIEHLLEEIGLTKSEIKVYLALLELGSSSTGPIVEKSRAASSKIYEVLEKLMQKGLASFVIKGGVKHFEAASPKRLLDYMKEKQRLVEKQALEVEKLLPSLEIKQKLSENRSETLVFKGLKGAQTAFDNILNSCSKGDEFVAFGFSDVDETFQKFLIRFHKKRVRQGVHFRALFGQKLANLVKVLDDMPKAKAKITSQESNVVATLIYKDTVLFSMAKDRLWIQIRNQGLADTMMGRFERAWKQDVSVVKGWDPMLLALNDFVSGIDKKDTFDALGAAFGVKGKEKEYAKIFTKFHKFRKKKDIHARWLFQDGTKKMIAQNSPNFEKGEIKFLPYKNSSPVNIYPYKNKTLIMLQAKEPTVITINNKEITQAFRKQFNLQWNQRTITLEGENAARYFLEDTLKHKDVWFIGGNDGISKYFPKLWKWYRKERVEKKVFWHDLIDHKLVGNLFSGEKRESVKYYEHRVLPPELSSPHVICFYGNKVANIIWGKRTTITIIDDKTVFSGYKKYFDYLWKKAAQK